MSKIINLTSNTPTSDFALDCSILSPEQKVAFHKFTIGENLFITGPGGTGKSKLIQYFMNLIAKIKLCRVMMKIRI